MKRLFAWFDDRTGIKDFVYEALYENIPGGARWRYVWGSTLVFTFTVQVITGLFLWMSYSASAQTAWESVYYIQYQMQGGWLLRGIHHFTAQAMIVLLVLHMMQVVVDGAYRAPREMNFWLGLILMQIVLGLSLTGYLLPWDQKGFWATRVATSLMGLVPIVGDDLQRLVVGGSDYGHHTLTRFFAMHAGLLPGALIFFLVLHVYMFRRHGITHKLPVKRQDGMFWPEQVLRDGVACLAVLAAVLFLVVRPALPALLNGDNFDLSQAGAELGAPADPSKPYSAARPEWYFLFLFQLLKYFPGTAELWGAIVLPGVVMTLLFLMPFVGRWKMGHRVNILFLSVLFFIVVLLTTAAWQADHSGPESAGYLAAVEEAEHEAERVVMLAKANGIPPSGAVTLMRNDPKTAGKALFEANCAICHRVPVDDKGKELPLGPPDAAPVLTGFASRGWIAGLLDAKIIGSSEYFRRTKHKEGDMVGYVTGDLIEWRKENKAEVEDVIVALSAQAQLKSQAAADKQDAARIAKGLELLKNGDRCAQCHKFDSAGELGSAPDLTGYGSRQWMIDFVSNPEHERFYADRNDRMPAFAKGGPGSRENLLSQQSIELIVDYLRGDWYEPPKPEVVHASK